MALPTALTGRVNDQIIVKSNTKGANGLPSITPVVWTSSDTSVATVQNTLDIKGGALITCFSVGVATITATAGAVSADFDLTVIDPTQGAATSIDVGADDKFNVTKKTH